LDSLKIHTPGLLDFRAWFLIAADTLLPVVKLFTPWAACTWLLTDLDPDDADIAAGLCDLGFGGPELGSVRISEIESLRGPGGLCAERDVNFIAKETIGTYAARARIDGQILT
jgi:hypothetical protein